MVEHHNRWEQQLARYQDNGRANDIAGHRYWRQKSAKVALLFSIVVTTFAAQPAIAQTLPGPPVGLQVNVSGVLVQLTWSPPTAGDSPTSYVVEAGSSSGATNVAQLDTGSTATTLSVNAPNGVYFVRVRARSGAAVGPPSNEVIATVPGGCPSLAAPSGFVHSVSGSVVTLAWQVVNGASSYLVEAGSTSGAANVATLDTGNATTGFMGSAPPGTYFVRVRARNGCSIGPSSTERVVTIGGCSAPAAPTGLAANVTGTTVTLTWGAVTSGVTTYVVEAGSTTGGANLAQLEVGATTTLSTAASAGTYYVRVRARGPCGTSAASNEVVVFVSGGSPTPSDWLPAINVWRDLAGVAPLVEEAAWSAGARLHSVYVGRTGRDFPLTPETTSTYYTAEGDLAARNSILYHHQFSANIPIATLIERMATAPFKSLVMLDPMLQRSGFGYNTINEPANSRNPSAIFNTTGVLDVIRGRVPFTGYPVRFPRAGATIPATCPGGTSCDGSDFPPTSSHCNYFGPNPFTSPTLGLPIWMQFGAGTIPVVSAASLTVNGTPIKLCTITEQTYTVSTADWQDLGRRLLRERGAVIFLPATALAAGKTYTVAATVNGTPYTWSFSVQ